MELEIENYLQWLASVCKRAHQVYRIHLERFAHLTGKKTIADVTVMDIVSFRNWYEERYSQYHANLAITVVKGFLHFCSRQGIKSIDPYFIRVRRVMPKSYHAVSKEEVDAMLATLRTDEFWTLERHLIIRLLWETGMRCSEICDMDISMIDNKNRCALIPSKKSSQMRWVFWGEETHELLIKYLGVRLCLNQKPALFIAQDTTTRRRDRLIPRTLERWITIAAHAAGLKEHVSPHSFRHGRAHWITSKGGTITEVNKVLGHTSIQSSLHYIQLDSRETSEIAKKYL